MKNLRFTLLLFLFLQGCTSFYPDQVAVPEGVELVTFNEVISATQSYSGKTARWSGVIADIKNLEHKTLLEIVYFDSRNYGRPVISDQSKGRFRVYVKQFLDPVIYQKGKSITALGELISSESGVIGEHHYQFPVLAESTVYLWKDVQQLRLQHHDFWPSHHYRYRGHYSPYHYGWGYSRSRAIKKATIRKPSRKIR